MTNKDRLISLLGFAPSDNSLEGELLDIDISSSGAYDPANSVILKKAAIKIMELLLTTADTTNENQYAIKYDRVAVLARIKLLKGELGLIDESLPTITGKSVW
jgi:hypothetical protein